MLSLADEMQELLKKQTVSADSAAEQLEQMRSFVSGLINWTQAAAELTDMIRSSSAETKILALNASIEAAKAGEKPKLSDRFPWICATERIKRLKRQSIYPFIWPAFKKKPPVSPKQ